MFINDIEDIYDIYVKYGIKLLTSILILYAFNIVIFGNSSAELQKNLNLLFDYCNKWKSVVKTAKLKLWYLREVNGYKKI